MMDPLLVTLWKFNSLLLNMAHRNRWFTPQKKMVMFWMFHSYVNVYQRVTPIFLISERFQYVPHGSHRPSLSSTPINDAPCCTSIHVFFGWCCIMSPEKSTMVKMVKKRVYSPSRSKLHINKLWSSDTSMVPLNSTAQIVGPVGFSSDRIHWFPGITGNKQPFNLLYPTIIKHSLK